MLNRDDINRWASKSGIKLPDGAFPDQGSFTLPNLIQFAALVGAAEREACADICDQHASIEGIAQRCAAAIRARGQA
jgi:hypothetical protein